MNVIIKVLKIIGWVVLTLMAIATSVVVYKHYEELGYHTSREWHWHDYFNRIQITYVDWLGRSVLRKVNVSEGYIVHMYKNDDRSTTVSVAFLADCQPNYEIVTSLKFSSGEAKKLFCNEKGNMLTHDINFSDGLPSNILGGYYYENLDGFEYSFYSRHWDLTKLDQELTLSKGRLTDIE